MPSSNLPDHDTGPLLELAKTYAECWNLSDARLLAHTRMGLVQRVTCADGTFAVLKCLSNMGQNEEGTAPSVLQAFEGSGAVRIMRADKNAYLMEYCSGPQVLHLEGGHLDEVAMPILIDVISRLRKYKGKPPRGVLTLANRCKAIKRALGVVGGSDAILFQKANQIADALLNDEEPTLLHGDFHHENVLRCNRPEGRLWLAIDPQGLWGDPAYEVANLFGNPRDFREVTLSAGRPLHLATMFENTLGLPAERTLGWAYVHSCISAAWSIEEGRNPEYRMLVAKHISSVL